MLRRAQPGEPKTAESDMLISEGLIKARSVLKAEAEDWSVLKC
jgi:hypothetical protein